MFGAAGLLAAAAGCGGGAGESDTTMREGASDTVFEDDFSDPRSGWPVADDDFVLLEYARDGYRIVLKDPSQPHASWLFQVAEGEPALTVEADATLRADPEGPRVSWGVTCSSVERGPGEAERRPGEVSYFFHVSSYGLWAIGREDSESVDEEFIARGEGGRRGAERTPPSEGRVRGPRRWPCDGRLRRRRQRGGSNHGSRRPVWVFRYRPPHASRSFGHGGALRQRLRAPRRDSVGNGPVLACDHRAARGAAPFGQPRVGYVGGRGDQAAHSPRDVEAHLRARRLVQPECSARRGSCVAPACLLERPEPALHPVASSVEEVLGDLLHLLDAVQNWEEERQAAERDVGGF